LTRPHGIKSICLKKKYKKTKGRSRGTGRVISRKVNLSRMVVSGIRSWFRKRCDREYESRKTGGGLSKLAMETDCCCTITLRMEEKISTSITKKRAGDIRGRTCKERKRGLIKGEGKPANEGRREYGGEDRKKVSVKDQKTGDPASRG